MNWLSFFCRRSVVRLARVRPRLQILEDRLAPANFPIADGDVTSLINAINSANTNNQTDTITLTAGSTYNLSATLPTIIRDSGNSGNTLTINGNNATLAGNSSFRLLSISTSVAASSAKRPSLQALRASATGRKKRRSSELPAGTRPANL